MSRSDSEGSGTERIFLVDAYALIFQVFYAIGGMSSPTGLPTNALFGFTRDMLFLHEEEKPEYLICAVDVAGKTFREELYPAYKANRGPIPDDLQLQIPLILHMLEALRVPVLGQTGVEADDILATVAKQAEQRGLDVYLCTNDKDCRQLITERIRLYNVRKRQVFGRQELWDEWGVTPEQVIDLQTLVGDPVDNVRGVPGIGVKTAAKLLQTYGTLDNLLTHLDEIPGKKQENLRACQDQFPMNRELVRLKTDVPLTMDWDGWRWREGDALRLLELFEQWGFRTFAAQARAKLQPADANTVNDADKTWSQGELFPFGANVVTDGRESPSNNWQTTYHLIDTPETFRVFWERLRRQQRFAFDLETTSLEPRRADLVGLAFCWQAGEAWYLPVRGPKGCAVLDANVTLEQLRPLFEDVAIAKVNQNIKYDQIVLRQHDIRLAGISGDPMVADYLLHAGERSHNMEDLARRYLNHQVIPITDLIGKKGKKQKRMDEVATARVAEYAGEDADVAWRLCERVEPELSQCNLRSLYDELEIPLITVLAELEFNGIRLDVPLLRRLSQEMTGQLAQIEGEIHALAGRSFNIASPQQLRQVLFDELKLPSQRKTGITGAASTDQESLERLAALGHELPRKILEHRHLAKLKGTYVDALPELVNPQTGRVHASFNQTVAATGRLSSSDPNLQNIPVRTEMGRQIRQAFIPEAGWTLLTADYSQVELRLLAHLSGDPALRRAFDEDQDIHAAVAAQIYGVGPNDVTAAMRRLAKTVNFGVIYGMSAHGLATRLGISREEGAKFIAAYFAQYPKVLEYQTRLLEQARTTGYVSTILGRRRAIDGIRANSTYQSRTQPEREAINMEIQGSAADLLKLAMRDVYRRLRQGGYRARLLLTVHDELVLETPLDELANVARLVQQDMTTAMTLDVPLKVDLAAGPNWLDVEPIAS
ncbi:MAG: DNA polymerase I [Gemmataceae bacterium]